jgi:hypothetical protein
VALEAVLQLVVAVVGVRLVVRAVRKQVKVPVLAAKELNPTAIVLH